MTVKELIKQLSEIENKNLVVKLYDGSFDNYYIDIDVIEPISIEQNGENGIEFIRIY